MFKSKFMGVWLVDLPVNILSKHLDQFNSMVVIIQVMISVLVGGGLMMLLSNTSWCTQFSHWMLLELLWTLAPVVVLVFLGFPSLKNLYNMENYLSNSVNLKVLGHQWYWEYSLPELSFTADCYPLSKASLYRMGETESLILPFMCKIRSLITSQDVIHSWCIPSLGFKLDACPGRLNYFLLNSYNCSFMVGQCSELCGTYHSWMPIKLEFTSMALFISYLKTF